MNAFFRFIRYWFPAVLCMAFIFYLSSGPRGQFSSQTSINFLIFKTLHVIGYAVLYFLFFRGFYSIHSKSLSLPERLLLPAIAAILYAASDEWHQTFSPHREGNPRDVLIDAIGIMIMYIYVRKYIRFFKRFV
jgi:VanZ family protein